MLFKLKSFKTALIPFLLIFIILIGGLINLSPTIIYKIQHGSNSEVGKRSPVGAELYGLKITHLMMPADNHRINKLAIMKNLYNTKTPLNNENKFATLGLVGSIGFLVLIGFLFSRNEGILKKVSFLNAAALLLASIGGFGSIFALTIMDEIRGYNRISIMIAYFCIFAVFYLWDQWKLSRGVVGTFFLSGILLIAILDQTNSNFNPQSAQLRALYNQDSIYIKKIESSIPTGSMVFQLPYVPFPENPPIHNMKDYDHFAPYIHSRDIRWSYGSMKGRESDTWVRQTATKSTETMIRDLAFAGFSGIYINRAGYQDNAAMIESEITSILLTEPIVSDDHLKSFFSMLDYNKGILVNYKN